LKLIKSIRRAWARASFATVIPVAAFVMGLSFSIGFTAFHIHQAHVAYDNNVSAYAQRVTMSVADDLAAGELANVEQLLDGLLPSRAVVEDLDRTLVAGSISPNARGQARTYPIMHNDVQIGTLLSAPMIKYQPPLPLSLAILLCFVIALIAALVMRVFAGLAASYLHQVTEIVHGFSLQTSEQHKTTPLIFSEFRKLNVATIRTTRRLAREISTLRDRAQYDTRTGLLNEHALHKRLDKAFDTARFDSPAALIVIELNDYADIADRVGSSYTDHALREITKVLKTTIRDGESRRGLPTGSWTLAALHSEQFGILVDQFGARDDLASLIREIQTAFRSPLHVGDRAFSVSLSGSIVLIPEDGDTVALIRQRADATIHDLKRQNKKGFSFYSPKLERQRDARIKLESELRQAVRNDRFVPLFQPKIDLATGLICGAEALARWRLDSGRLASPSVFIELAEETGLINAIGAQIMRKACMEAVRWNQAGHRLNIAVNVSPKQFERDGLSQMILDALAKSGLSPRQLEIEITESLAIQHPERVRSVLKPLRKLGIKLAVDDFGTGHSNLATLTQLDFDVFKIDRQFVSGIPHDGQANAIVDMILSMAKTLEMQIVGEGIETAPQAEFLKAKGCHIGQGYLYSPPVTAEAFRKMIEEQPFAPARMIA